MLIALAGKARSGKNTVARMLGGHELSFAEPLKHICEYVFGFTPEQLHGSERDEPDARWTRPNGAPLTARFALQTLGTEWGRNCDPDIWVKVALAKARQVSGLVVITDCRFINEARAVIAAGGEVWRIVRPGGLTGAAASHPSEAEQDSREFTSLVSAVIQNSGTLDDLAYTVSACLRSRY